MSAIWGIIDTSGKKIKPELVEIIKEEYLTKKIDTIQECTGINSYMACGVQFVNNESKIEKFPYKVNFTTMVADVILDNRDELINSKEDKDKPDGEIMFDLVQLDLNDALRSMRGAYAFAKYDLVSNECILAADMVGNRSVYYYNYEDFIIFSTLYKPIVKAVRYIKFCDYSSEWFSQFMDTHDLRVTLDAVNTPIAQIKRVEPGEYVRLAYHKNVKITYWNPLCSAKEIKLDSYEDYKELVLDTFQKCVEDVIRDGADTGIFLSGGLDSNSVAAFAAPYLKAQGRKLYSFTSVPKGYSEEIDNHQYGVCNETYYIKELCKRHDNIEPDYIYTGEEDIVSVNEQIMSELGILYKTVTNIPWMYEAYKRAADKGCGILLSGQYGNITISFGDFEVLFTTLWLKEKYIDLYKELKAYSLRYKNSRLKILKELILHCDQESDFSFIKRYMYDKPALRQISEMEVALSLETGVIHRDPTRDPRLIELVLSLPLKVFVREGRARRLVRDYMKDLIPESIAQDEFHRGRQGVGGSDYIEKNWNTIVPELKKSFELHVSGDFWKPKQLIQKLETPADKLSSFEKTELIYTALAVRYMENMRG